MPKYKTFKIRSYHRFHFLNGVLLARLTVNWHISKPFTIMSHRNVHLNEVHPEKPGVQKSKARDVLNLVEYITEEDSAAYLWEICTLFTTQIVFSMFLILNKSFSNTYNTLSTAFTQSNLCHFLSLQKMVITLSLETAVKKVYELILETSVAIFW